MQIIDRLYLAHPENGSRMMVKVLKLSFRTSSERYLAI